MHHKIKQFIQIHQLIKEGDELILGVSGGADSMLLLDYFYLHQHDYKVTLKVAHVHHGLRKEADLDAELVEQFCKQRDIPFFRHDCNVSMIAKQKKMSEEEAGREERYRFFKTLMQKKSKIVTAHHMNDQAETILMRLIRGSGIKGLGGIAPKRENIIRPFLCLTREEIETYCKTFQVPYREDITNQDTKYTRNKIRLELLPFMEKQMNPAIIKSIARAGMMCQEAYDFIESQTLLFYKECCLQESDFQIEIDSRRLLSYPIYMQKCILLYAIQSLTHMKDYTLKHIESCLGIINGQVGKKVAMPSGLSVIKTYDKIIFTKKEVNQARKYYRTLNIGHNTISEIGLNIEITINPLYLRDENRYTKVIDYAKIKQGLCIRTREPSDYMSVSGGHKKLTRIMIDDKIPVMQREQMPLLADGNEIIWIIGYRFSTRYYITEKTENRLGIKIYK